MTDIVSYCLRISMSPNKGLQSEDRSGQSLCPLRLLHLCENGLFILEYLSVTNYYNLCSNYTVPILLSTKFYPRVLS